MGRPAVFLDRDGTINEEVRYLSGPEQLTLLPGAAEALTKLRNAGFALIVLTNQSGIARGYFSVKDLEAVNRALQDMLVREGVRIDAFYYCPHHPEHGDKTVCDCRKPKPGMAERAARELGIDLARSYFVGDKCTDMELGMNAGGRTVLVLTGFGMEERTLLEAKGLVPDGIFNDLAEAADWIIKESKGCL